MDLIEEARDILRGVEQRFGLAPGIMDAVWSQEGGGSMDLGLRGPMTRHGQAKGPFQIMEKFWGPVPDTFEGQANLAGEILAKGGSTPQEQLASYYGRGIPLPGHPTTDEYVSQVMGRMGNVNTAGLPGRRTATAVSPTTSATPAGDLFSRYFGHLQGIPQMSPERRIGLGLAALGDMFQLPEYRIGAAQALMQPQSGLTTELAMAKLRYEVDQAQREQAFEREKWAQQQRMKEAGQWELEKIGNKLYRVNPVTGEQEEISGTEREESTYALDEDLDTSVAAGDIDQQKGIEVQEQRDRAAAQALVNLRKEYGKEVAPSLNKLDSWNQVRNLTLEDMNPVRDQMLVKAYAKMLLPDEAVMSGDAAEIAAAGLNVAERYWKDLAGSTGELNDTQRIQIMQEMRRLAEMAETSAVSKWRRFHGEASAVPGIGEERAERVVGTVPPLFTESRADWMGDRVKPPPGTDLGGGFSIGGS